MRLSAPCDEIARGGQQRIVPEAARNLVEGEYPDCGLPTTLRGGSR